MTDKHLHVNKEIKPSGFNHSFDVGIAMNCGVEAACIYNHLCYWILHNKIHGTNQHKGKTWTYDSHEKMTKYLPYMNSRQIKYGLQKLCDHKIIIKDNFNKDKFDKTNWYALTDESILNFSNKLYDETNLSDRSTKSESSMRQNCPIDKTNLSNPLYTNTIQHTDDISNSLKVLDSEQTAEAGAAEAAEIDLNSSSSFEEKPKRARKPAEFSLKVRELGEKLINILVQHKPNYSPPRNLAPFLTHVDFILQKDKRDPQLAVNVFSWALADSFWAPKMYKPNPAEYLRKQFDQLEMLMNAKPPKKERKFAPSSKQEYEKSELYQQWNDEAL